DAPARVAGGTGLPAQGVDEGVRLRGRQRLQRELFGALEEVRPLLAQLVPRECEQEDRRAAAALGELLHEVEEERRGPVEVVEDEDERPLPRQRLAEDSEGPDR